MYRPTGKKNNGIDTLLTEWDASLPAALVNAQTSLSDRRAFLCNMLKSGALLSSTPLWMGLSACDRQASQQQLIRQAPWQTFAAVQQQLFPADGNGPSASDIHATLYLKLVLDAPDTEAQDRTFLLDGITWLNALTDTRFGKAFVVLSKDEQEQALRKIAASTAGEHWLSQLLLYIMEALLTDPVYGANPDGIGWQWLEHQAGFPRPPKAKRYWELL
jgi:gluconate 2-dehydrogenase gamma chain